MNISQMNKEIMLLNWLLSLPLKHGGAVGDPLYVLSFKYKFAVFKP